MFFSIFILFNYLLCLYIYRTNNQIKCYTKKHLGVALSILLIRLCITEPLNNYMNDQVITAQIRGRLLGQIHRDNRSLTSQIDVKQKQVCNDNEIKVSKVPDEHYEKVYMEMISNMYNNNYSQFFDNFNKQYMGEDTSAMPKAETSHMKDLESNNSVGNDKNESRSTGHYKDHEEFVDPVNMFDNIMQQYKEYENNLVGLIKTLNDAVDTNTMITIFNYVLIMQKNNYIILLKSIYQYFTSLCIKHQIPEYYKQRQFIKVYDKITSDMLHLEKECLRYLASMVGNKSMKRVTYQKLLSEILKKFNELIRYWANHSRIYFQCKIKRYVKITKRTITI
ncbi:exported protein (PHISTc), unknown function [Hepatocystis sp. ex Piliocolobus tephrosceles]|nr:exported protein (PHISTc), unknown function [Hepatocystis sp. ex Piliocolobus tephrosceles]